MPLYARFSDAINRAGLTYSNDGLTAYGASGGSRIGMASVGHASGKWYFEFTLDAQIVASWCSCGILAQEHEYANQFVGQDASFEGAGYYVSQASVEGTYRLGTLDTTDTITVAQGDIIGIAVDLDNGRIWFSVNGTWIDSGNPGAGTGARYTGLTGSVRPAVSCRSGEQWTANFGEQPFNSAVPAGFNPGWYTDEPCAFITDVDGATEQILANIEEDGRLVRWALGNSFDYGSVGARANAVIDDHYNAGKWYWEVELLDGTVANLGFCAIDYNLTGDPTLSADAYVASQLSGAFYCAGTSSGSITYGIGDTLGFAVDMGAGTVTVYKNGVSTVSGACSLSGHLYPLVYGRVNASDDTEVRAAWKSADFAYTPPAGYEGPGDFDQLFVWDSIDKGSGITLHRSDAIAENTTDGHNVFADCGALSTGKWYWEVVCTSGIEDARIGVAEETYSHTTALGSASGSSAVLTIDGNKQKDGGTSTAFCAGGNIDNLEVVSVALDMDNGRIWFGVDGTWCDSGDPGAGTGAAFTGLTNPMAPAVSGSEDVTLGNSWARLVSHPSFMAYEPPAGFKHLAEFVPPVSGDGDVDVELEIDGTGRITLHGDGDPDITLEIDATGDLKTRHGDGAPDIDLEITSTGRVTVHGNANIDLDVSLIGSGTITRSGTGDPDITLELDSTGTVTPAIRGVGNIDLEIDPNGTGFTGKGYDAEVTLPLLEQAGTIVTGTVSAGAFLLPVFQLEGSLGPRTDITLPMLQLEASVASGEAARGAFELPVFTLDATVQPPATISADITLPRLSLVGALARGVGATADNTLPRLSLEGSALVGAVLDGDVDLPALTLQAQASPPSYLAADITLPGFLLRARGYPALPGLVERAYSLNTESLGVVPYTAFPYHAIGRIGSSLYGFTSTGLTLLEGADDEGADIDASFTFGITDFSEASGIDGELKKRVTDAYIGYRGNGDLLLTLTLDGEALTRTYRMTRRSQDTGLRQRRAKLNRGDKSRYWQLKVANVNGADFEIDSIGLLVRNITSKVR